MHRLIPLFMSLFCLLGSNVAHALCRSLCKQLPASASPW